MATRGGCHRSRIVGHLAECDALYSEVMDVRVGQGGVPRSELVASAYRRYRPQRRGLFAFRPPPVFAGGLAA
ncbi:MAG: hypothetical protein ACREA0_30285, partial [bacterium]